MRRGDDAYDPCMNPCGPDLWLAIVLTVAAMWKHRDELRQMFRESGR